MEAADKTLKEVAALQDAAREQIGSAYSLGTDAAMATLQQFKPPK